MAALYLRGIDGHEVFGFTLVALASGVFLLGSSVESPTTDRAPGRSVLRWFGRHSYEIYLFHIIVLAGMRNVATKETLGYGARLPWLLLFLCLTALAAALVARYVSEPANAALRRRSSGERYAQ